MIELRNVTKDFGGRRAVADVSFDVARGEIYGCWAITERARAQPSGCYWVRCGRRRGGEGVGHECDDPPAGCLMKVGAIFESPVFYDYLSGLTNLEILSAYSAATPRKRILDGDRPGGLTGRAESKVQTYSHGMRARLALAQALLPNPELLILDEPSDGLDPEGIHEMRIPFWQLQRELGLTIMLSSHTAQRGGATLHAHCRDAGGEKVFEARWRR